MLKISNGKSHTDHGLTADQMRFVLEQHADREAFFISELELPESLGTVPCGLYGPAMGDEDQLEGITYAVREGRDCCSRLVNKPTRPTRKLVVIGGPVPIEGMILYTVYGGPVAPREPGDTSIPSWEEVIESRVFWALHALADERGKSIAV